MNTQYLTNMNTLKMISKKKTELKISKNFLMSGISAIKLKNLQFQKRCQVT